MADILDSLFDSLPNEENNVVAELSKESSDNKFEYADSNYEHLILIRSDKDFVLYFDRELIDRRKRKLAYFISYFSLSFNVDVEYFLSKKSYDYKKTFYDNFDFKIIPNSIIEQISGAESILDFYENYIVVKLTIPSNLKSFIRLFNTIHCILYPIIVNEFPKYASLYVFRNDNNSWKIINKNPYFSINANKVFSSKRYLNRLEDKILFFWKDIFYPDKKNDVSFTREKIREFKNMFNKK